jgi:hypothetical protein
MLKLDLDDTGGKTEQLNGVGIAELVASELTSRSEPRHRTNQRPQLTCSPRTSARAKQLQSSHRQNLVGTDQRKQRLEWWLLENKTGPNKKPCHRRKSVSHSHRSGCRRKLERRTSLLSRETLTRKQYSEKNTAQASGAPVAARPTPESPNQIQASGFKNRLMHWNWAQVAMDWTKISGTTKQIAGGAQTHLTETSSGEKGLVEAKWKLLGPDREEHNKKISDLGPT